MTQRRQYRTMAEIRDAVRDLERDGADTRRLGISAMRQGTGPEGAIKHAEGIIADRNAMRRLQGVDDAMFQRHDHTARCTDDGAVRLAPSDGGKQATAYVAGSPDCFTFEERDAVRNNPLTAQHVIGQWAGAASQSAAGGAARRNATWHDAVQLAHRAETLDDLQQLMQVVKTSPQGIALRHKVSDALYRKGNRNATRWLRRRWSELTA
jgi:hypothetical protein